LPVNDVATIYNLNVKIIKRAAEDEEKMKMTILHYVVVAWKN